jgi:hypothetical protein
MIRTAFLLSVSAVLLSGCITTSMQGYTDRQLPTRPVQHMVAYVAAPGPLAANILASITDEARKRGIVAEDALTIFPPTRTYNDAEVRQGLAAQGVDGVLVINVGDTGVMKEYAGTVFYSQYSGSSMASGTATSFGNMTSASISGTSRGTMTASAAPTYRYSRQTNFNARLLEPATGRNLWVGSGQVNAGGLLFVGNNMSAANSVTAIFDDLQKKGIIGAGAS